MMGICHKSLLKCLAMHTAVAIVLCMCMILCMQLKDFKGRILHCCLSLSVSTYMLCMKLLEALKTKINSTMQMLQAEARRPCANCK